MKPPKSGFLGKILRWAAIAAVGAAPGCTPSYERSYTSVETPSEYIQRQIEEENRSRQSSSSGETPQWVLDNMEQSERYHKRVHDDLTEAASTAIGDAMKSRALTDPGLTLKQRTNLYRGGSALESIGSMK